MSKNTRIWSTATATPYSSIVGCSILLRDSSGRVVGQLALRGVDGGKEEHVAVAAAIAEALGGKS